MSWSGVGKMLVGFAGLWIVGLLLMWLSFATLKDAFWSYPVHDWKSDCTLQDLKERCHPSDCEWGCPPCECD